ncbi:MAG: hypothetical protein ABWX59_05455 [Microbacteriaceae bacterium]
MGSSPVRWWTALVQVIGVPAPGTQHRRVRVRVRALVPRGLAARAPAPMALQGPVLFQAQGQARVLVLEQVPEWVRAQQRVQVQVPELARGRSAPRRVVPRSPVWSALEWLAPAQWEPGRPARCRRPRGSSR